MTTNQIVNKLMMVRPMLFRNDNGMGYVGGRVFCARKTQSVVFHLKRGDMVITNPMRIRYGLLKGSSDFIGWTPVVITPDMVGQELAVFTSVEIKVEKDRLSKEQRSWNKAARKAGGIVEVWHGKNDEIEILKGKEIE